MRFPIFTAIFVPGKRRRRAENCLVEHLPYVLVRTIRMRAHGRIALTKHP